ncbi:MAG: hypothetical protein NXH75_06310 [Halobacteriovoraceae bacterium]|nr:hypothetical protein [Halobacteriovoraceae bacterium]
MKLLKSLLLAFLVLGSFSSAAALSSADELSNVEFFKKVIPKRPPINDDGPGGPDGQE